MNLDYLFIFWQSNLIEVAIYHWFYRGHISFARAFFITSLANSITHPLVFFAFMASSSLSYLSAILAAELFAVVVEAILHAWAGRLPLSLTLRGSVLANLISWQLAPILTYGLFLSGR